MSELLLSTNGLTKQYGHHKAVDKVNLHIKKGAIYGSVDLQDRQPERLRCSGVKEKNWRGFVLVWGV